MRRILSSHSNPCRSSKLFADGCRISLPPQVQLIRMSVPNRIVSRRVFGNLGDGEIDFGETLAFSGDHTEASV